jgi:hypothetical protein
MSRLEYLARPLVAFDASNKDHRRWYWEFMAYKGWGKCPVRFICTEEHGDNLPSMIQRMVVDYYVNREFKPVVKKQQMSKLGTVVKKLVAQKTTKTVDKRAKR